MARVNRVYDDPKPIIEQATAPDGRCSGVAGCIDSTAA